MQVSAVKRDRSITLEHLATIVPSLSTNQCLRDMSNDSDNFDMMALYSNKGSNKTFAARDTASGEGAERRNKGICAHEERLGLEIAEIANIIIDIACAAVVEEARFAVHCVASGVFMISWCY